MTDRSAAALKAHATRKRNAENLNNHRFRSAQYFMAHDHETGASIGDPVLVTYIASYADAPAAFDAAFAQAKSWAERVCDYPANADWHLMTDDGPEYDESIIWCDADGD